MGPNHLLKLLADNRGAPRRFEAKAGADEATLYLYDAIAADALMAEWLGGIAPEAFVKELNALAAPTIHLRINSPGGDVFAARAMEQAIRSHPSRIVAHVDGVAASAATFLVVAADEAEMAAGGMLMIHDSWTLAFGNSDELLAAADLLDKIDGTIAESYAARTDLPVEEIRALMDAETWYTAEEAVTAGFADRVAAASAKAQAWNMSAYARAPRATSADEAQEGRAAPVATAPEPATNINARRRELALRLKAA